MKRGFPLGPHCTLKRNVPVGVGKISCSSSAALNACLRIRIFTFPGGGGGGGGGTVLACGGTDTKTHTKPFSGFEHVGFANAWTQATTLSQPSRGVSEKLPSPN